MESWTAQSIECCIDDNIQLFLEIIKKESQIDSKKIHTEKSDFPIFRPANFDYFEYKYFEGILEQYIRDYLVSRIFFDLFNKKDISVFVPKDENNVVHFQYNNESFGDDYPLAFIVQRDDQRIGYRYSGVCLSDDELESWLKEFQLHHIEILDWTDTENLESSKIEWGVTPQKRSNVFYVTLHKFLIEYFSEKVFELYITKVREAIEKANKEIGFNTIPELSLRYLSDFKETTLKRIFEKPLDSLHYRVFDRKGEVTADFTKSLFADDYRIIDKRFKDNGLYKSLVGNEKFARCFLTLEYLYQVFQKGNENYFDYSSLATGYFKSVELLLERIMQETLNADSHEELWIKSNSLKYKVDDINYRYNPNPKASGKQVRFKKENVKFFSIEMGPLIWFLHDNNHGWYISEDGRQIVHDCLLNYNLCCRNEHLHKDIIDDISTIECIRDNTLLCLYYLLGGCKLSRNWVDDGSTLGLEDNTYDRLNKVLTKIPRGVKNYYIQFCGQEKFKAVRLLDQENPFYDSNGNIQSRIRFVKVNDFHIEDYDIFLSNISRETEIYISRDNVPEKIWWYTVPEKGPVLIEW